MDLLAQYRQFDRPFIARGNDSQGIPKTHGETIQSTDDRQFVMRRIRALQRGPLRFGRNHTIAYEGDPAKHIYLVLSGAVRTCRTFRNGTRSIVAFYLPGELFGWTGPNHSLSTEMASDTMVLFLKRNVLYSLATEESRIASFLLAATTNELRRTQEHAMLMGRDARCRVATFLIDLWERSKKQELLDLPMCHQDIADHLGLTIETISRILTRMEQSGLITRLSPRTLTLRNPSSLLRLANREVPEH
jgi:CRP/FNR family transcriptional regulator, nitrogen fixation regulation protein